MNNFFQQVYNIASKIPSGKVATYGQIAALLGNPRGARTVGWALQGTPEQLKVPCHRVINRLGEMAPGYAFGGSDRQRRMLEDEGISFMKDGRVDMKKHLWSPDFVEAVYLEDLMMDWEKHK
jgi:methylated-DNA-protein-cysteine methyltransferase-like protein